MNRSMSKRWFCGAGGMLLAALVLVAVGCSRMASSKPEQVEDVNQSAAPPLAVAPFDAAAAKRHQEAWAEYLGVPVEVTNSIGMKLLLIPPGEFLMGSPESEEWRRVAEGPQHRVRITKPFYLGVFEVTQSQWESVMGSNPSNGIRDADSPVENVSWEYCQEFIRRLNERSEEQGEVYRLPTEAEWEYACRAGSTTRYYFGDDASMLGNYSWHLGTSGGRTHPVGGKKPNSWGLYDMHGNVWEWCSDWYGENYYANSPVDDPQGPATGSARVERGGDWCSGARQCRSSYRGGYDPAYTYGLQGFRLSRTVSKPSR